MFFIRFALILLALHIQSNIAERCFNDGAEWQTPSTVLKCVNGTWTATGCLTEDGKRMNDGDLTKTDTNLFQCQKVDSETMKYVAIGCMKDGHLLAPTQSLVVGDAYFTCVPTGHTLVLQISGCIGPEKKMVPLDTNIQTDTMAYKCTSKGSKVYMEPFGCVYNNKTYSIDEFVADPLFWYQCQKLDEKIQLVPKGCVQGGFKLNPNDMFHVDGFLYKCVEEKGLMKRKGIGCLEVTSKKTIVEHLVGEKWLQGNDKMKYYVQCSQDEVGLVKTAIQCSFTRDGTETVLKPGCMKKVGRYLYQCLKIDSHNLKSISIENPNIESMKLGLDAGFKVCV